jgi:hypothetical protein
VPIFPGQGASYKRIMIRVPLERQGIISCFPF